jgi:ribokinase
MTPRRPVVWVVGSLNVDLVVRVEAHPQPGETVLGGDLMRFPGGKGANQAAAAALAAGPAARVRMLGRTGADADGEMLLAALRARDVDIGAVTVADAPTGVALITLDRHGQNAIVVSSGANRLLTPDHVDEALAEEAPSIVLTQLETPLHTVVHLARHCAAHGVPLVLNAAPPVPLPDVVWHALDTLIVNEHEAAFLDADPARQPSPKADATATVAPSTPPADGESRRRNGLDVAERLAARGPRAVIVTLGADGVAWAGTSRGTLPGFPVDVVDTTGAGDAFCGAYVATRADGADVAAAVRFASAAGALAVTRPGAMPSLPGRAEIDATLDTP